MITHDVDNSQLQTDFILFYVFVLFLCVHHVIFFSGWMVYAAKREKV